MPKTLTAITRQTKISIHIRVCLAGFAQQKQSALFCASTARTPTPTPAEICHTASQRFSFFFFLFFKTAQTSNLLFVSSTYHTNGEPPSLLGDYANKFKCHSI